MPISFLFFRERKRQEKCATYYVVAKESKKKDRGQASACRQSGNILRKQDIRGDTKICLPNTTVSPDGSLSKDNNNVCAIISTKMLIHIRIFGVYGVVSADSPSPSPYGDTSPRVRGFRLWVRRCTHLLKRICGLFPKETPNYSFTAMALAIAVKEVFAELFSKSDRISLRKG